MDELAPRDVVSRAMADRMRQQGVESLWLDATGLADFGSRFPTIAASLMAIGLDPSQDWLPIAPAAHYLSGGVLTDLSGATALPGLWAAGEVACTGVHGANRLASNSLLEGMVFGARLAEAIGAGTDGPSATGAMGAFVGGAWEPVASGDDRVSGGSGGGSGCRRAVARRGEDQGGASADHDRRGRGGPQRPVTRDRRPRGAEHRRAAGPGVPVDRAHGELANLVTASKSVLASATVRCATRGAHARSDYPEAAETWRRRIVHTADGVALLRDDVSGSRPR